MFTIIWEFHVSAEHEQEFVRRYGAHGDWTTLFQRSEGCLGSDLLRDRAAHGRYVTIDRWASAAAYEAFRSRWRHEYEALDRDLERLTERETKVGEFVI